MEKDKVAAELLEKADELRPAMQAMADFIVQGAKLGKTMKADPDEVWAATVVNVADGMKLDLEDAGQMGTAAVVAELIMDAAGYER